MEKNDLIFVAGHRGLAGGAIHRQLQRTGYTNIITRSSKELNLRDREATRAFFEKERPKAVAAVQDTQPMTSAHGQAG